MTSVSSPAGAAADLHTERRRRSRRRVTSARSRLVFAMPAALALLALSIYPLVQLVRMSLSEVTAGTVNRAWPSTGVENFRRLLAEPTLSEVIGNTLLFVVVVTVLGVVLGLGAALALRTRTIGSSALLALMVFVWALPPVVNGSIWRFLLSDRGLVNEVLRDVGLTEAGLPFLFNDSYALLSVAIVNAWAVVPFNALVFRSALLSVPDEVLEAAAVDGANRWQEIRHILVPQARATAVVLAILTVVYAFRSFDFIYVMTSGGPGTATTTLPYLAFVQSFIRYDYGLGAATAVVSLAVVLVIGLLYARDARARDGA